MGRPFSISPVRQRCSVRSVRATLQIGDPSVLATLTGIPTVGDFRIADMAVGGQGAPLVPYFDWLVFRSSTVNRLLAQHRRDSQPDHGIPKNSAARMIVIAFDTGPGNMLVDSLMHEFYGKPCDIDGRDRCAWSRVTPIYSPR